MLQGIRIVMREWIAIALGGMIGTLVRHAFNLMARAWNPAFVPLATLAVNLIGCLAIGILVRWSHDRAVHGQWWEMAIRVGVLGGLTTFSTFALDVIVAWQSRPALAAALAAAHVTFGIAAVWLGMQMVARPA